jgi:hypothetical protein
MNQTVKYQQMLHHKFNAFGKLGLMDRDLIRFIVKLQNIDIMSNNELQDIYN